MALPVVALAKIGVDFYRCESLALAKSAATMVWTIKKILNPDHA